MTLVQYYNQYAKSQNYRTWTEFVNECSGNVNIEWIKKQLKREYKSLLKQEEK